MARWYGGVQVRVSWIADDGLGSFASSARNLLTIHSYLNSHALPDKSRFEGDSGGQNMS